MSTASRVEEPRAWLAETEPEPGVTWSLREAWVPPFSRPVSRGDTAEPRTAGPFNVRLTCSLGPLAWSEDRRREADPVLIRDQEHRQRAVSVETHASPRM